MPLRDQTGSGLTITSFRTNYVPPTSVRSSNGGQTPQRRSSILNDGDDYQERLPQASEPSGVYNVLMTDSDMALTKRKFVKVSSVGEVELSPDRVEFCIQIYSTKHDMGAARESIRKRDDFIMLALKKLGVSGDGISATQMVKKYKVEEEVEYDDDLLELKILRDVEKQMAGKKKEKEPRGEAKEKIKVVKELYVVCDSLNQYMELFSIVNEKLDRLVNVSPPVIRITPENLQSQSRAAAKLAMSNAVEKASQLLHSQKNLKATVGKLFYSVEDSLTITDIAEYHNVNTTTDFESLKWKRNNKIVTCKLTCLFEVNSVKSNRRVI